MSAHRQSRTAFLALLIATCLVAINVGTEVQKNVLTTVEVFYESLCPDSIYFITKELGPAYTELKDFVDLKLVPFGKASWIPDEGKRTKFTCQHGPNECAGNRAQACAIWEIEQTMSSSAAQSKAFDVVNCAMSSSDPSTAVPQCAQMLNFSEEAVERIKTCSESAFGDSLLVANGLRTKAFETPLKFVPSILINGVKSSEAFRGFKSAVCAVISATRKSSPCGPSR